MFLNIRQTKDASLKKKTGCAIISFKEGHCHHEKTEVDSIYRHSALHIERPALYHKLRKPAANASLSIWI